MSWIYLAMAILFEVAGTTAMKFSQGFSKLLPSLLIFLFYVISTGFMNLATKRLDISLIYAIWAGVGTALITLIGILWFREPGTILKLVSISLIIAGVVGLNLNK